MSAVDPVRDRMADTLGKIASGEAFRCQRFAEDDDAEYFLRAQRGVQQLAAAAIRDLEVDGGRHVDRSAGRADINPVSLPAGGAGEEARPSRQLRGRK